MSALRLTDAVTQLPRVGPSVAKKLALLEIESIADLLHHLPRRYEDWSTLTPLSQVDSNVGKILTVRGKIELINSKRSPRKHMLVTEALLSDSTGSLKAIWFQQPFLSKTLHSGQTYLFSGQVERNSFGIFLSNPGHEAAGFSGLRAIYPQTAGLTSKLLRQLIEVALQQVHIPEELPELFCKKYHLVTRSQALHLLHQPRHSSDVAVARRRLQFEELLRYQLRGLQLRSQCVELLAPAIPFSESVAKQFVAALPFQLTTAQRKAAWRILQDMQEVRPMHRLLQGDVGSGKTVVAALAMLQAIQHGFQTALLAPTEILAQQHAHTLTSLLGPFGQQVQLVTSGITPDMTQQVFVGTHALLQEKIDFQRLGLLVVDEEHRFGVNQRQQLVQRSGLKDAQPHVLSMTATPIPRTLALTVYGGVDVTYVLEKPAGRKAVATVVREPNERPHSIQDIGGAVAAGQGVFVVCPLINSSDALGVSSVQSETRRLKVELPGKRIGMLHGRLSSVEKQKLMDDFRGGSLDLLVSTAVIEVGVDIPRATLMVIEGAERFGLAQLHQLRGRVGRGVNSGTCILHPSAGIPAPERLRLLETTQSGYELAEHDLRLRGMGELFGTKQSGTEEWLQFGLPEIGMIELAQQAAVELWAEQPELALKLAVSPHA